MSMTKTIPSADRIASEMFARIFRAYMESSDEIQQGIKEMCEVINDPDTDEDDRDIAFHTLIEALWPTRHDGELGIEIGELRKVDCDQNDESRNAFVELDERQQTFAERLKALMQEKQVTQDELAKAIGVQQPAISMMLNRTCRPQRRTVEKIAMALDASADALWPTS